MLQCFTYLLLNNLIAEISGIFSGSLLSPSGRISSCEEGNGISGLWGRIERGKKVKGKEYHMFCIFKAIGKNIKWGGGGGDRKVWG